jgi:hypothetical protein
MAKKTKKFNTGGLTITPTETNQSSTYPFTNQSAGAGMSSSEGSGMNQTFNIQPSATAGQPQQPFKKGGKVKSPTMTFQTYTKTGKEAGLKTVPAKKMAKGGTASSRADGCAVRGKTRA